MPIYEFYCKECHCIYSFYSKTVNTGKIPLCPICPGAIALTRQVSLFAIAGNATKKEAAPDMPFDEGKMAQAMARLEKEAARIEADNPRQAADLMRRLSDMTGMRLGPGMSEALERMGNGEDPDRIEAEMGDRLEAEEPFLQPQKGNVRFDRRAAPAKDDRLYDL